MPKTNARMRQALKVVRMRVGDMVAADRGQYAATPLDAGQKVYLKSWVLPILDALVEEATGGEPVPEWMTRG